MLNLKSKGFSLVEVIVGIALMLVVFGSVVGVFRMAVKVVRVSHLRVGAVALATEQMEFIRNLPYNEIGTVGGIPQGNILQTEDILLNEVNYTKRVLIQYVDDVSDGEGDDDENDITADYKRVKIEVSWESEDNIKPIVLISDIVPKGIENIEGGGTLKINVFDSNFQPVSLANVHIENNNLAPPISVDVFTNIEGKVVFPGALVDSNYEITVSKIGFSTDKTYDATAENIDPRPGHYSIIEGETTEASFSIDLLSSKTVRTYKPEDSYVLADTFLDESLVSATSSVEISEGDCSLSLLEESGYLENGYLVSSTIIPEELNQWGDLLWSDTESASTTVKYSVLYFSGADWVDIPNADLSGNEEGFENSPVDLSVLATTTYSEIRLRADLSTIDASTTPLLHDWQVEWQSGRVPFPLVDFNMRGEKIIGYGPGGVGDPIYKYSEDLSTDNSGSVVLSGLEWDNYLITVNGTEIGYDISESCPFQSVSIVPNSANVTDLVLLPHESNSLLVYVQEGDNFISDATVRLYKTGYNESKQTSNTCGQSFFSPLVQSTAYNLEITKSGYQDFTLSGLGVSGYTTIEVELLSL
ncbi:MAG: carboxypeptidase-like regulatory domain-containing protein [Candidatus Marinimicrobia bacterium]|nr:carboxypeptidase-like regulatory domain-containing protein [Candidatus Neomarinimicrobiota bacterium]